jgi:flagellar hook-basal body complex protein FliE
MIDPILGAGTVGGVGPLNGGHAPASSNAPAGKSFKHFLLESIGEVNHLQQQADQAVQTLATGGETSPAEVLTAVQKADLAFRTLMQIRNKLVAAYDEVRQMRIG